MSREPPGTRPVLLWLRQDLRLADNPALALAVASGRPVLPLFILEAEGRALGGASGWWLAGSLAALARDFAARGASLLMRSGRAEAVLDEVLAASGAAALYWNRRYEPDAIRRDGAIQARLTARGLAVESANASLLFEPPAIRSRAGSPFGVFTPFWRACLASAPPPLPRPAPDRIRGFDLAAAGERLADWRLRPRKADWAHGLRAAWTPGEAGAQARLAQLLDERIETYGPRRDLPAEPGTSRLSPHLRWGEIGPRQLWHATATRAAGAESGVAAFQRQLGWREFSYSLLYHHRDIATTPLRREFADFPWRDDPAALVAWQQGRTGYPLVDAGLRALWAEGWLHNRVRMVVASFLVKHLLLPWQRGEAWFWDTLVDADPANNPVSWQWVAGCGADAVPFFRIFNPVLQGRKFDPRGAYIRRWVPELASLPDAHIHAPWEAPEAVRLAAGVVLGETYPRPIVALADGRKRALAALAAVKSAKPR